MADIECCYFECTFTFQNVDELEWHLAEDHHKCYSYQCEQCYLSRRPSLFPTQAGVREHLIQDHGLQDHYFRHLFSPEIDRKREKIQRDLDKCLKQSDKEFSSSHIEVKVLCEREVQTEQVHQEKEQTKQTVQLREKVPYLPPEIAVIKVEPEDVEIIAIKSNGKSSYNGSAGQQLQPSIRLYASRVLCTSDGQFLCKVGFYLSRIRQLDEELRNEISASRTQSTGSNDSIPLTGQRQPILSSFLHTLYHRWAKTRPPKTRSDRRGMGGLKPG
uniref:C2H2-type domain-containing protein n=1 Tax=Ditylenchus dipsaci TaxID=166011 RepID=A0A915DP70_9BILA